MTSPNIFGGSDTIYNFYNEGTVGLAVPLSFFTPAPSCASSPPGAHNRGSRLNCPWPTGTHVCTNLSFNFRLWMCTVRHSESRIFFI